MGKISYEYPYIWGTNKKDKIVYKKYYQYGFGLKGNDLINFSKSPYWAELNGGPGNDTIKGGRGSDYISGEAGKDVIYGNAGNDTIHGGAGNDIIHGGKAGDAIIGGSGNDKIYGDAGSDEIYGEAGKDIIYAGKGSDGISGGNGNDIIYGQYGHNLLMGDAGNDKIYDGKGSDTIAGGSGNDKIYLKKSRDNIVYTEAGKDTVYVNTKNNVINLGTGKDTLIFNKSKKSTIVSFTNPSDKAVLKFSSGKIKVRTSDSNIILKCGKNTVTITNSQQGNSITVISGKTKKSLNRYIPAADALFSSPFLSRAKTDISSITEEVTAWNTSNTDMQALIETENKQDIPDVAAYFVDINKQ